jgi:hypothetical protein
MPCQCLTDVAARVSPGTTVNDSAVKAMLPPSPDGECYGCRSVTTKITDLVVPLEPWRTATHTSSYRLQPAQALGSAVWWMMVCRLGAHNYCLCGFKCCLSKATHAAHWPS